MPTGKRGGANPGERRGGRKKGTPNKIVTEGRLVREYQKAAEATGGQVNKLGKVLLDDIANFAFNYATRFQPDGSARPIATDAASAIARQQWDERNEQFERWMRLAYECARAKAPYESPTFRAIVIAPPPDPKQLNKETDFTIDVFSSAGKLIEHQATEDNEDEAADAASGA